MSRYASAPMLQCAANFRDVAETVLGLRAGVLYRSDLVWEPAEADIVQLESCNIRLVLDLRAPGEIEALPNAWFTGRGVEIISCDVNRDASPERLVAALAENGRREDAHAIMQRAYAAFASGAVPALSALSERIAAGDLPVLVHCAAGKDRTGFVIAVLLLAIGIGREHVLRDYLASAGRTSSALVQRSRASMQRHFPTLKEEALAYMAGTHVDFLDAGLAGAANKSGSFEAYLAEAGLGPDRAQRLAAQLKHSSA